MMKETVQAADSETHCQCCGRKNRKLHLIQGGWVGQDCSKRIRIYRDMLSFGNNPDTHPAFYGYETQLLQVKAFCERA